MSAVNATTFVCQESFHADNTTSCMRYPKLKRCVKDGDDNHLTFYCVGENTIAIGGAGPLPLPTNINMTVYMCTMDSCPIEAPADNSTKGSGGKKGDNSSTGGGSTNNGRAATAMDKKLTMSGFLVLALIVSQMVLF
ncbi:hypothetical protein EDD21DRAFT_439220 [Dissophora ornata]|nr:hypothetical protein BGZ58_003292 [Dissophora ornata]KAI8606780.1 hypothetical protein EDD21DRAFT_439220 [Dissophora ornata]